MNTNLPFTFYAFEDQIVNIVLIHLKECTSSYLERDQIAVFVYPASNQPIKVSASIKRKLSALTTMVFDTFVLVVRQTDSWSRSSFTI